MKVSVTAGTGVQIIRKHLGRSAQIIPGSFSKRIFDFALALILVVPGFIICIVAMPIVAVECRSSPLFFQTRVGRCGRLFRIMKLRTMHPQTPHLGSHLVGSDSITRSGRLLRRLKIDELPQLINVLAGSMSFVGPRPCLPSQQELIAERRRRGVDGLLPGITGPAQVAGLDMSDPPRLARADSAYLAPWSLKRDIAVLVKTAIGQGRGDAAGR